MERVDAQGVEILASEQTRVEKLLKGKLSAKKILELNHRLNILTSFEVKEKVKDEL